MSTTGPKAPEDLLNRLRDELAAMALEDLQEVLSIAQKLRSNCDRHGGFLARLLDLRWEHLGHGRGRCEMPVTWKAHNHSGYTGGIALFAMIDYAMGAAVRRMIAEWGDPGTGCVTLEAKVNFISAVSEGTLVAQSEIVSSSSKVVVLQCRVTTADDDHLVALATGSFYVVRRTGSGG